MFCATQQHLPETERRLINCVSSSHNQRILGEAIWPPVRKKTRSPPSRRSQSNNRHSLHDPTEETLSIRRRWKRPSEEIIKRGSKAKIRSLLDKINLISIFFYISCGVYVLSWGRGKINGKDQVSSSDHGQSLPRKSKLVGAGAAGPMRLLSERKGILRTY